MELLKYASRLETIFEISDPDDILKPGCDSDEEG